MNVTAQKFQSLYTPVCKSLARWNHRTTLPQSALSGCQLPQRGSRGRLHHSPNRPKTATLRAIFIAPTKLKNRFPLPFNERHSLSFAFAQQLPQGGSRGGVRTIQRVARKPEGFGRFSSPLRKLCFLHFTAHRGAAMGGT